MPDSHSRSRRSLASDNHSGVHPRILQSIVDINFDHDHSYEGDTYSHALRKKIKETFGSQFESHIVFNGTAANVLALNHLIKPWQAILCSDQAHLHLDECAAGEKFMGSKILLAPTLEGKIRALDIENFYIRRGDQHFSQLQAVSITQPTELGTVYSLDEIKEIFNVCKKLGLYLHIDGARLSNAVVQLQTSFKEMCQYADAISFGGTKNGLLGCELVLLNSESIKDRNTHEFKFERKQAMQLPSKSRFLSQQFLTYFNDDLWKDIAEHSLGKAQRLKSLLEEQDIKPLYAVQSNAVFCVFPKTWIKALREIVFFYVWDEAVGANSSEYVVRLMTSFDTTEQDLIDLCTKIKELKRQAL